MLKKIKKVIVLLFMVFVCFVLKAQSVEPFSCSVPSEYNELFKNKNNHIENYAFAPSFLESDIEQLSVEDFDDIPEGDPIGVDSKVEIPVGDDISVIFLFLLSLLIYRCFRQYKENA